MFGAKLRVMHRQRMMHVQKTGRSERPDLADTAPQHTVFEHGKSWCEETRRKGFPDSEGIDGRFDRKG